MSDFSVTKIILFELYKHCVKIEMTEEKTGARASLGMNYIYIERALKLEVN